MKLARILPFLALLSCSDGAGRNAWCLDALSDTHAKWQMTANKIGEDYQKALRTCSEDLDSYWNNWQECEDRAWSSSFGWPQTVEFVPSPFKQCVEICAGPDRIKEYTGTWGPSGPQLERCTCKR